MTITKYFASAIVVILFFSACATQEKLPSTPDKVTTTPSASDFERAESFLPANLAGLVLNEIQQWRWIGANNATFRTQTTNGRQFMLMDLSTGEVAEAFDHQALATALSEETQTEVSASELPVNSIEMSEDLHSIRFFALRRHWDYVLETGSLSVHSSEITQPSSSILSPDGQWAAFRKDHNVWVRNMSTGEDLQLTPDGEDLYGYATDSQGWSRSERPIIAWSDNSQKISTYRLDERGVGIMHILETKEDKPILHSWPYAIPGDSIVPMHKRVVLDVANQAVTWLSAEADHQRTSNCCGLTRGTSWADNQFNDDGTRLAYVSTSRDYTTVTLRIADTKTGDVRDIYTETDLPFFESNLTSRGVPNWRMLFDTNEFIWFTRSDEWGHLYLYDATSGVQKNRITQGEWNVVDILHLDEQERVIWFTAVGKESGRNVYQEYLYKVNFDGSGLQLLTPEEGHHEINFSAQHGLIFDTWSDYLTPKTSVLRDMEGNIVHELGKADISALLATGFQLPEPFVAKARDGVTDIYGLMFKPSNFDPTKSYPIINSIYPGPQVGSINTPAFSIARRGNPQSLAELGFIVVQVDAMGTPMRSKSFHAAYYGDMADNGLPDQAAAMKQLGEKYSWIDLNRAGMYGHSGGGFATAAALLTMPEFFKVGVASAGNMDNRGYTYYWGEKFQGQRVGEGESDSFKNQALHLKAANLKGKLLITYGTMDTNVHPNMTLLLVNELIREDKDFDLMVFPNRGHGYFNEPYHRRITGEYFVRHLIENPF